MFTYHQNCPIIFGAGAIDHLGEYVSELGNIKKARVRQITPDTGFFTRRRRAH